jgi:hypothetical protein
MPHRPWVVPAARKRARREAEGRGKSACVMWRRGLPLPIARRACARALRNPETSSDVRRWIHEVSCWTSAAFQALGPGVAVMLGVDPALGGIFEGKYRWQEVDFSRGRKTCERTAGYYSQHCGVKFSHCARTSAFGPHLSRVPNSHDFFFFFIYDSRAVFFSACDAFMS